MERLQAAIFEGSIPSELSGEFILPDTYPDVKRILRVSARPIELGRFIGGGTLSLELNGAVDYIVIFSSDGDGGERLHSVHFAAEYSCAVSPGGMGEGVEVITSPRVSACTARLSNPRKLSLRSTVITDVRILSDRSTLPRVEGENGGLRTLTRSVPTLIECEGSTAHESISETLEPDPSQPAIDELITCDAQISFHEIKPQLGDGELSISLKGELVIDCIYKAQTEEGDYRSFSRRLPLAFIINADDRVDTFSNAAAGTLCAFARGIPTEINASVAENSYGERRCLEIDVAFDVLPRLYAETETQLTLDAYSTEYESECELETLELSRLGKAVCANFSVNESLSREDDRTLGELGSSVSILDSQAQVAMNSASVERGRVQLSGEAELSCIILSDGELAPLNFKLPIKCELSVGELVEPIYLECSCNASELRVRFDQSRIYADFEVTLCAVLLRRSRESAVGCVRLTGERISSDVGGSTLLLCYPAAGEGLWQVAKRYKTTVDALEAANPGELGRIVKVRQSRGV